MAEARRGPTPRPRSRLTGPRRADTAYAEITFKSGAVVTFEVDELSWTKRAGVSSLRWTQPDGAVRQPIHVDINEIAAVVFVKKEEDDA